MHGRQAGRGISCGFAPGVGMEVEATSQLYVLYIGEGIRRRYICHHQCVKWFSFRFVANKCVPVGQSVEKLTTAGLFLFFSDAMFLESCLTRMVCRRGVRVNQGPYVRCRSKEGNPSSFSRFLFLAIWDCSILATGKRKASKGAKRKYTAEDIHVHDRGWTSKIFSIDSSVPSNELVVCGRVCADPERGMRKEPEANTYIHISLSLSLFNSLSRPTRP